MHLARLLVFLASLVSVACLLLGTTSLATADGSASDDAKPSAWVGAPTAPKPTPCRFGMVLLTSWKALDEDQKETCSDAGYATHGLCHLVDHCESYANAAVLGSEIWGYTWSDDSFWCLGDECSSADSAGVSHELVRYTVNPAEGCSATIAGVLAHQFRWRIEGYGNLEVEVAGGMTCQGSDLKFPVPTIHGGKSAFAGSRSSCAPKSGGGTITIGAPPFTITIPISVLDKPKLPPDESIVACLGMNAAGPVPLTLAGETITFRGYAKVRSYADEPLLGNADVQGWIRDADPGLTVMLECKGRPHCKKSTSSTCKAE